MKANDSIVTIHMAASLDGFIARRDGSVEWMETHDEFANGESLSASDIAAFLDTIDCYVMGSKTYELAMSFESNGFGWQYGDKPTFVLTHRKLTKIRDTVQFHSGDLSEFFKKLRAEFRNIWIVGGGAVCGECLRLRLADEVRYSILPIVIGDGIRFFENSAEASLHLCELKAYKNGIVDLRYQVKA